MAEQDENWCWCNKCQGLFYAGNQTFGVCPAGGGHDSSGSANYSLTYNTSDQPNSSPYRPSSPEGEEQSSYEAPPNPYEQSPSSLSDPGSALSQPSPPRRGFRQIMSVFGFVLILALLVWSAIGRLTENPVINIRFRSGSPRLVGLFFMGFGLIFGVIGVVVFINTLNFLHGTVAGQGRIASCHMQTVTNNDKSVSYVCQPTVHFTTASGQEINFVSSDSSSGFHEGDNVPVRYHPDHPQDALISSFPDLWLLPLILGGCGGLFFLIGLVIVLAIR